MDKILAITFILFQLVLWFPDTSVSRKYKNTVTQNFLWPETNKESRKVSMDTDPDKIVQVSILLPHDYQIFVDSWKNSTFEKEEVELESAQNRTGPGILAGFQKAYDSGLTNDIVFNLTFRDTQCDQIYAPKSFTDAILDDVDVLFGPACEYSLGKL